MVAAAGSLDELAERLAVDDELLQAIGWRGWHSVDGVAPVFTDDLPAIGDDDWEILSADTLRAAALYLDEPNCLGRAHQATSQLLSLGFAEVSDVGGHI